MYFIKYITVIIFKSCLSKTLFSQRYFHIIAHKYQPNLTCVIDKKTDFPYTINPLIFMPNSEA